MTNREIDVLIAEKVMGHLIGKRVSTRGYETYYYLNTADQPGVPRYSTDIAAAFQVVEKFGPFTLLRIDFFEQAYPGKKLTDVTWTGPRFGYKAQFKGHPPCTAESASVAICLAALKAVGHGI